MKAKFFLISVGIIFLFSAPAFAQNYGKEHYNPSDPNYMAGKRHYIPKSAPAEITEQSSAKEEADIGGEGPVSRGGKPRQPLPFGRTAINPQTGEVYPGVEIGVINPSSGEFYPAYGGGYFNPSTGEFFPK